VRATRQAANFKPKGIPQKDRTIQELSCVAAYISYIDRSERKTYIQAIDEAWDLDPVSFATCYGNALDEFTYEELMEWARDNGAWGGYA